MLGAVFAVVFWMMVEETPTEKTKCVSMVTSERRFLTSSMTAKGFSVKKVLYDAYIIASLFLWKMLSVCVFILCACVVLCSFVCMV